MITATLYYGSSLIWRIPHVGNTDEVDVFGTFSEDPAIQDTVILDGSKTLPQDDEEKKDAHR